MAGTRFRVAVLYNGTIAPDHGGRRILEQMAWLAAQDCSVSVAPVFSHGAPLPEVAASVATAGIDVLDPIELRDVPRMRRGVSELPRNMRDVALAIKGADWIIEGNTFLAGLHDLARASARRPVVSWDGDASSRWHSTYARWLVRRDPVRAVRRSLLAIAALRAERHRLRAYDFVTVPGPADIRAMSRLRWQGAPAILVPNVVRLVQGAHETGTSNLSLDIVFVGSGYGPNVDGLRWFLRRVWPTLRKQRPGTELTVAGRDLDQRSLFDGTIPPSGLAFVGRVTNVEQIYKSAKVVIVPLFYGSGVPNKFLEALAVNAGIVLTNYVARAVGSPRGLRSADGSDAWSASLLKALDNPTTARVDSRVRSKLLATNGPTGFDSAMRNVYGRARGLRCG